MAEYMAKEKEKEKVKKAAEEEAQRAGVEESKEEEENPVAAEQGNVEDLLEVQVPTCKPAIRSSSRYGDQNTIGCSV